MDEERQSHVAEQQLGEVEEVEEQEQKQEQHSEVVRLEVKLLIWAVVEAADEMTSKPG